MDGNAALTRRRSDLDRVYRATAYLAEWTDRPGEGGGNAAVMVLRVGAACPALESWLAARGADCWSYLTAANPGSQARSAMVNATRTAALVEAVTALGKPFLRGRSQADDGTWPAEESLLVADLDEAAAAILAVRFGQNAFLSGRRGGPVCLCWTPLAPQSG